MPAQVDMLEMKKRYQELQAAHMEMTKLMTEMEGPVRSKVSTYRTTIKTQEEVRKCLERLRCVRFGARPPPPWGPTHGSLTDGALTDGAWLVFAADEQVIKHMEALLKQQASKAKAVQSLTVENKRLREELYGASTRVDPSSERRLEKVRLGAGPRARCFGGRSGQQLCGSRVYSACPACWLTARACR